jgi:hypothetical protein
LTIAGSVTGGSSFGGAGLRVAGRGVGFVVAGG